MQSPDDLPLWAQLGSKWRHGGSAPVDMVLEFLAAVPGGHGAFLEATEGVSAPPAPATSKRSPQGNLKGILK